MVADGSLAVLEILSRASAVIAEGEVLQLDHRQRHRRPPRTPISRSSAAKTAALFAAACQIGAVVGRAAAGRGGGAGGLRPQSRHRLPADRRRARLQRARRRSWARRVGDDFRDGKITLPVMLAFARGGDDRARLLAPRPRGPRAARRATSSAPRACSLATARSTTPSPAPRPTAHRARQSLAPFRLLARQAGDARPARFLHRPGLLTRHAGLAAGTAPYTSRRAVGV